MAKATRTVIAQPEIYARKDRRKPWRVTEVADPSQGYTDLARRRMQLPSGEGAQQVAIRLHEAMHAAHTDPIEDLPRRMIEEVRMDALAHHGELDTTHRHDTNGTSVLKKLEHPGDAVLWYWQYALTWGDIAAVRQGKIKARADLPRPQQLALKKLVSAMGDLAPIAADWVRKTLESPTDFTATQAAQWAKEMQEPEPPKQPGQGGDQKPQGQGQGDGQPQQGEGQGKQQQLRVQPKGECAGQTGAVIVEVKRPVYGSPGQSEFRPDMAKTRTASNAVQRAERSDKAKQAAEADAAAKAEAEGKPTPLSGLLPGGYAGETFQRAQNGSMQPMPTKPTETRAVLTSADKGKIRPFSRALVHSHVKDGHGIPVKLRRGTRADGTTVLRPERWRPGDRAVFSARRRGGALAIDCSGSMDWDWDVLKQAISEMPGLTVVAHTSREVTRADIAMGRRCIPILCLLADAGRWAGPTPDHCDWTMNNGSDIEALQWLNLQRGPRIWLSDGRACSGEVQRLVIDHANPEAMMASLGRAGNITRVATIADALALCRHQHVPPDRAISARTHPNEFTNPYLQSYGDGYDVTP